MEQYCIYLRKSRADAEAEARGEGETLARHEKMLLAVAKRDRYHISKIYREIVSGETIAARPQMQQLLQDVEQGLYAGVLVMEVERLARGDTIDQGIMAQTFRYSDTKIITPMKVYDPNNEFDEEYFEFGLFMSRREYKTINRRLQRGRAASAKEGKYAGNITPYGYTRVKLEHDKGFRLVPDPEEAKIVQLVYDWYLNGELQEDGSRKRLGSTYIARKLNAAHVPTRHGGKWGVNSVRGILINPVYTGKIRWNYRPAKKSMENGSVVKTRSEAEEGDYILADGLHEALISEEAYHAVQEDMHHKAVSGTHDGKKLCNPLAGLAYCACCKHVMVRRPHNKRFHTDTLMCNTLDCPNVSADLEAVERRVLSGIRDWLKQYEVEWSKNHQEPSAMDAQIATKKAAIQAAEKEQDVLKKQLDKAYDFLEQGIYDTDVFLSRSQALNDRIQDAQNSIKALQEELHREQMRKEGMEEIIPKAKHVLEVYGSLTDAKSKNELLKSVLERVEYYKGKSARWSGNPDDFEVVLFPKLPK